jgi:hypothetical protein
LNGVQITSLGRVDATTLLGTALPRVWNQPRRRSVFGDVVLLAFLLLQCLDGVFTYVGVITLGSRIEANPLIAALMAHFGDAAALVGAKLLAAVLGIGLHVGQIHTAVALLAAFYLLVAIVPWIAILFG